MTKIVDTQWTRFEKEVIHKEAPEIQKEEIKKAFFAGAFVSFSAMINTADLEEKQAVKIIESLAKELEDYRVNVSS